MTAAPGRILVTGASGFVGRHLLPLLAAEFPAAELLTPPADLQRAEQADAIVRTAAPDVCVHLAAVAAVTEAQQDQDRAWQVNLHGTLHLARALLRQAPECLLLFVSSADAYGSSFRAGVPVTEESPLAPMNVYSATKAAADLALGSMVSQGLKVTRLRPTNHIGPGQSQRFVVAAFARQVARIAAGLQPPLLEVGNLDTHRDFLDVRDVCAAYVACIKRSAAVQPGAILNIASGQPRRIRDVLADLMALAGVAVEIRIDPARLRREEIPWACADATRARQVLGWTPGVAWERTLRDVMQYWRQQLNPATENDGA